MVRIQGDAPRNGGERNPIHAFDPDRIAAQDVDPAAIARAVTALPLPPQGEPRLQALADLIGCIDLTTLSGDDTPAKVRALCAKARAPIGDPVLAALGRQRLTCAAVCVYHAMVEVAIAALEGSAIPVATVSAGFPDGLSPLSLRVKEVEASVAAGADEIDIVIRRGHVLDGDHKAVYDEVRLFREACGPAHLKAIIGTGDLVTPTNIAKASMACMMAGADFIKTSTGKEKVNATPEAAMVMARCIADWHERTGYRVGFKPAGGIATAEAALTYRAIMASTLGEAWLKPDLFRIGASSLLGQLVSALMAGTVEGGAA